MNGTALPQEHGFPARLVVPGLYGYVSACKWVTDIQVTTFQAAIPYWAQRGWSQQAPIKTESRIDVPSSGSRVHAVAEEGLPSRDIAGVIGGYLGLPTVSVAPEDAEAHFGWIGRFFGMDITASSARTREQLDWTPTGPTLFEDITAGAYALRDRR